MIIFVMIAKCLTRRSSTKFHRQPRVNFIEIFPMKTFLFFIIIHHCSRNSVSSRPANGVSFNVNELELEMNFQFRRSEIEPSTLRVSGQRRRTTMNQKVFEDLLLLCGGQEITLQLFSSCCVWNNKLF